MKGKVDEKSKVDGERKIRVCEVVTRDPILARSAPPMHHGFHAGQHLLRIFCAPHPNPLTLNILLSKMGVPRNLGPLLLLLLGFSSWWGDFAHAYQAGDAVPVARRAQFHGQTTSWTDQLGRHCPHFGVDTEVVMPLPKPVGFTDSESYKVSFQFGREKYLTPWLLVIGRKQVPMLEVTLRHSGGDLEGVTAKVVPMPEKYLKEHESIRQKFVDPADWPKHILVHYSWVEKSEIDVVGGLYVLFFSGNILFVITAIYILQTSKDKLSRFLNENVVQTSMVGEVPKAD